MWQHWTKALVWSDDVDISAFHSCVVVDLWPSILNGICYCLRVFWSAVARLPELELERRANIKFLVKFGKRKGPRIFGILFKEIVYDYTVLVTV